MDKYSKEAAVSTFIGALGDVAGHICRHGVESEETDKAAEKCKSILDRHLSKFAEELTSYEKLLVAAAHRLIYREELPAKTAEDIKLFSEDVDGYKLLNLLLAICQKVECEIYPVRTHVEKVVVLLAKEWNNDCRGHNRWESTFELDDYARKLWHTVMGCGSSRELFVGSIISAYLFTEIYFRRETKDYSGYY